MASSHVQTRQLPFLTLLLFLTSLVASEAPSRTTTALILPVSKHAHSLQYTTVVHQRTPLVPVAHVVHLGGDVLWVGCDSTYISSSYRQAHCDSAQCSLAHHSTPGRSRETSSAIGSPSRRPWCSTNGTCMLQLQNVFTGKAATGELGEDALVLKSTDGFRPGPPASVPRFLFSCAPASLLEGLASGAKGMVGLGHAAQIALPTQLSSALNFSRTFAICLPASPDSKGVIFFGGGPYVLLPNIDVSKLLTMTPLINARPRSLPTASDPPSSHDYMIGVTSIRVNGNRIPVNSAPRPPAGRVGSGGGAKISTVHPYALLQTSIYTSLVEHFVREAAAADVATVAAVAPFGVCFATNPQNAGLPRPPMPVIDLVLHTEEVFWRIFETNSMVRVGDRVSCLAFLDGGVSPETPIVLGGHQLEDNLVQFDLVSSNVGFTSSLLLRQTGCANFDFASNG